MSILLIDKDYQYQYKDLLFGSSTSIIVEEARGILSPAEVRERNSERQDGHGEYSVPALLGAKTIEFDLKINSVGGDAIEQVLADLRKTFAVSSTDAMLVFRRPFIGHRFLWCQPRRIDIPSNYNVAHGLAEPSIMLRAADPRTYSYEERVATAQIANAATSASFTALNDGDFEEGAYPVITITGPATNPRILNATQNRTIRIDIVVATNQELVIDVKRRSITLEGVDRYDAKRTDNEWWTLEPGLNNITFQRSNSAAPSTISLVYRDVFV